VTATLAEALWYEGIVLIIGVYAILGCLVYCRWLDGKKEREMSRQTEEARQARDIIGDNWRNHRKTCPQCDTAAQSRRPRAMCGTGRAINLEYAGASAAYAREKAADRAPIPGQAPLFVVKGE